MDFDLLPEEVVVKVFSYFSTRELLKTIARVSERWKNLALKPILWKRVELHHQGNNLKSAEEIVQHLNRCYLARRVEFKCIKDFNWLTPLKSLQFVRKLKFSWCNFRLREISQFVNSCPNVESFSINYCRVIEPKDELDDIDLPTIKKISEWQKLKSFELSANYYGIDQDVLLITVANECKLIEKIRWSNVAEIRKWIFVLLLKLCGPQLKVLELRVPEVEDGDCRLLQTCAKLERLLLLEAETISSDFVSFSKIPCLKRLEVQTCSLTSTQFRKLGNNLIFKQLEDIVCQDIDWSMEVIRKHFPRLKTINGDPVEDYL